MDRRFALALLGGLFLVGCPKTESASRDDASAASTSQIASAGASASAAPSASTTAAACRAGEVPAFDMETGKPICAPPCPGKQDKECPSGQACTMAARSSEPTMGMAQARANEVYVCRPGAAPRASASSAAPSCKAPHVAAYDMDTMKPVCAPPCPGKKDSECPSGQACTMALKSNEPTIGMAQARANEIYVCKGSKK